MFLIVGLGNPGKKYEITRHNAGRIALRHFIDTHTDGSLTTDPYARGQLVRGRIDGIHATVFFPDTYMNVSGDALVACLEREKLSPGEVIVVHDDVDLPIGTMRVSMGRGSGGHNGLISVIKKLNTKDFVRVRIGVSPVSFFGTMKKPKGEGKIARFLLNPFSKSEERKVEKLGEEVSGALEMIMKDGYEKAMNAYN